jgi:acyl-CoA synthetase (NDP forming)
MDAARRAAVAAMLGARTVAVVGASPRPDSFGSRMILEAQRSSARMHLVNPRYDRIDGVPCAPSLQALDDPVDLVLLGVPDTALVDQLKAAAATGARSAVVFGAARGLREEVRAIAVAAGMALCGGGCMGFVNNVLGIRALGYLEPDPLPHGGICLVTHSGSAFSTLLRSGRGLGFSLAVSSGQELVTETADYIDYALDNPATRIIGLLLETPRSAPRLRHVLRRAAERDVPVIMLTVGGSPPGAAMVAAHSGALAGADAAWSAFCAATGAVRVRDMAELTDTLELFAAGRRARASAGGIATVHDSGAERALAADLAHELRVEFAALTAATVEAITDLLDEGLVAANPLDVWGTGVDTRGLLAACLQAMTQDPAVGVTALAVDLVDEYDGDTAYPDAVIDVAHQTDEPLAVLTSLPSAVDPVAAQRLRANGIPVLEGARSGLAALGHLARWPLPVDTADTAGTVVRQERRNRWRARLTQGWDPALSFDLLADYGVPVVDSRDAYSVDEALGAAAAVGYPVALKTLGAEHKSDLGGVMLGLPDEAALRSAYTMMAGSLGAAVTVSAMARGDIEVSIGVVRDDSFGPLVVVAAGGTLVEVLADRVVACPPVSPAGALRLLDALQMRPMLGTWRGRPPADIDALADVIVRFSELAVELGDVLDAVEANPVIVSTHGVVAVDALVIPVTS